MINVRKLLNENTNLKTAFITVDKKLKEKNVKNDKKDDNDNANDSNKNILSNIDSIELELYRQIKNIIYHLSLSNILQLPHIMDMLTILGDSNTELGSVFLTRFYEILEFQINSLESTYVSTDLNTSLKNNSIDTNLNLSNMNPVFGIQLSKITIEVDFISKQVYSELDKIYSFLLDDITDEKKIEIENEKSLPKNKLNSVNLSASKNLKNPEIEKKIRTEKRILDLQNKIKTPSNSIQKNIKFNLISDNIIDKLLDLSFYLLDIIYSFSTLFQTAASARTSIHNDDYYNHNNNNNNNDDDNDNNNDNNNDKSNKTISINLLSLSSVFYNFDFSSSGFYLSKETGKSIILSLQFLYEEVGNKYIKLFSLFAELIIFFIQKFFFSLEESFLLCYCELILFNH